ncbi:MAG: isoaspartyl peptidase/L-asparaginase [Vicingaceae bacterium]
MKNTTTLLLILFIWACHSKEQKQEIEKVKKNTTDKIAYGLVIHGGAGSQERGKYSDSLEQAYHQKLAEATEKGYALIEKGTPALDVVVATIEILENSPLFNAGKGAVFTHEENNQLDASIMDGATLEAGAVAGVKIVKNPIKAAQAVLQHSPHVLLSGNGADQFAISLGLDTVPNSYFFTPKNFNYLKKIKAKQKQQTAYQATTDEKFGTVGCAVLDKNGKLAAGTSTGGMTNKRYGRIGDSPIIGAGTYANDLVAVSCTGHGEYFIRYAVAYDLAAQIAYQGKSVKEASEFIIHQKLKQAGGQGGLISIDQNGNVSMPFNTSGMFRAVKTNNTELKTAIYKD